jgi:hypothetical protein
MDPAGHHAITRAAVDLFFAARADPHTHQIDGLDRDQYFHVLNQWQEHQDRPTGPTWHPAWADGAAQCVHSLADPHLTGQQNLIHNRENIELELYMAKHEDRFQHLGAAVHEIEDSFSEAHAWRGPGVNSGDPNAPIVSFNVFDPFPSMHQHTLGILSGNEGTHYSKFDTVPLDSRGDLIRGTDVAAAHAAAKLLITAHDTQHMSDAAAVHDIHTAVVELYHESYSHPVTVNDVATDSWVHERDYRLAVHDREITDHHAHADQQPSIPEVNVEDLPRAPALDGNAPHSPQHPQHDAAPPHPQHDAPAPIPTVKVEDLPHASTAHGHAGHDALHLTPGQHVFVNELAARTGLDKDVVSSWVHVEENGPYAAHREQAGNHNWLNIGYTDHGARPFTHDMSIWGDPVTAADATAAWLKGDRAGPVDQAGYHAANSIHHILDTAGSDPQAQILAIGQSGWASASSYQAAIQSNYHVLEHSGHPAPDDTAATPHIPHVNVEDLPRVHDQPGAPDAGRAGHPGLPGHPGDPGHAPVGGTDSHPGNVDGAGHGGHGHHSETSPAPAHPHAAHHHHGLQPDLHVAPPGSVDQHPAGPDNFAHHGSPGAGYQGQGPGHHGGAHGAGVHHGYAPDAAPQPSQAPSDHQYNYAPDQAQQSHGSGQHDHGHGQHDHGHGQHDHGHGQQGHGAGSSVHHDLNPSQYDANQAVGYTAQPSMAAHAYDPGQTASTAPAHPGDHSGQANQAPTDQVGHAGTEQAGNAAAAAAHAAAEAASQVQLDMHAGGL